MHIKKNKTENFDEQESLYLLEHNIQDKRSRRLRILTKNERQQLFQFQKFNLEERIYYFSLKKNEKLILSGLKSIKSKVHFIIQLGYFKAKKILFSFDLDEVNEDINYILTEYFDIKQKIRDLEITKPTKNKQKKIILNLTGFRECTSDIKKMLNSKAIKQAIIDTKPIYIFRELITFLDNHRIVYPSYSFIQDTIGNALLEEKRRLEKEVLKKVPHNVLTEIDQLFLAEKGIHELTFIRKEPKDFSLKEIRKEVNRRESLKNIYLSINPFIRQLNISNENIKYYAALIGFYTIYKLKRFERKTAYIYIICFIYNRYQRINDNLINSFRFLVNKYRSEAKTTAKKEFYEFKFDGKKKLKGAGKVLKLFLDESIPDNMEFSRVKEMAFSVLKKEEFEILTEYIYMTENLELNFEWEYYKRISNQVKRNTRYIFKNLEFKINSKNLPLFEAINFLQEAVLNNTPLSKFLKKDFPLDFVPSKFKKYLFDREEILIKNKKKVIQRLNGDKYEFYLYSVLNNAIESGEVSIQESVNYKSFKEDLISDELLLEKDRIIKDLELPYLNEPIENILNTFQKTLEDKYKIVNQRITNGENKNIKIKQSGEKISWTLPYSKKDDEVNNPIYNQFPQVSVIDLLNFVNKKCNFIDSFTHILNKSTKTEIDNSRIIASIIALGTNIGLFKMGSISDISFKKLSTTTNNYLRLETLKNANDKISNSMANLPIFEYYNIEENIIHSSLDGQKWNTQFNTVNSRYSPKYFGLEKGIVDYTLVANHIPINAKIIGANEHESHYVFDLIYNNTSEILPNIFSTDTHGANAVNFFILDAFGYMFAPRYRDFTNKTKQLTAFDNPTLYDDLLIKPTSKINTSLIKKEWENIQKIIISLALKTATQSTIVRKLSSYLRKNKTRKALCELNNIIQSIYFLDWIDRKELRQNVQKAINRGESYHKLKRAIFFAFLGKFRVKSELEQQIVSACTRLIANSIIYFNSYILSKKLLQIEENKNSDDAHLLKSISPIGWRHVNLYGDFKFKRDIHFSEFERISQNLDLNLISNPKSSEENVLYL